MKEEKKKAKELIDKFKESANLFYRNDAKACAILCCDEIIKVPSMDEGRMIPVLASDYDFWIGVRKELTNK